jgi:hypothetical protein
MIIGIPIYNGVDLLDVAAPYEIFNWMKEKAPDLRVEVYLLAEELNDVKTLNGLTLKPHKKFRDFSTLDVLWVPGGDPAALKALMNVRQRNPRDPAPRLNMTGVLLPERAADEKYPTLCSRSVCCLAWVVGRRSSTQALPATATPSHRRGHGQGVPV